MKILREAEMANESRFSVAELRALLRYEPETGKLFWLERDESMGISERLCKAFNAQFAHKEAFTAPDTNGYRKGLLMAVPVIAHRVAWAIHHGNFPEGQIDHINGIRHDNRIENLRDVTPAENQKNQRKPVNNTSGFVGVCWCSTKKKWQAQIMVGKRARTLGRFHTIEEAVKARKAAEAEFGFHNNHGRSAA